ncbi:ABC transporter substrate-binding protein [Oceanicella sp. SM1341]|uniref:ABC transporter substrate-binding protein n=1 Tax=Oceanicella sp. SM1341 TaxID=1548889 RepID=UPI000E4DBF6C|nr:ABC transporter substrate-binding protein [Oceanicella sp. SM1341]
MKTIAMATGSAVAAALLATAVPAVADTVLNVAFVQDIRGTQPGVDRDGQTDTVQMHVVEGLVAYATDFSVKPMLAESIEESEDGLTYTFPLRHGVTFHNGAEMTAEEVKWSWDRYMDPATNWRCRSYFSGEDGPEVTAMEVVDPYTVRFTLASPSATFLGNLARFDCGSTAVLHPDSVDAEGNWVAPVGTGPFTFGDIRPGQYVELLKFPDYVSRTDEPDGYAGAKEALVDRVRFNILPEAAVKKTAFLAGDLDISTIDPSDIDEIEAAPGNVVQTVQTAVWDAILINTRDPLLSDKRIRKAIALSIDPEQMVAVVTEGKGSPNPSPVPPMSAFYGETEAKGIGYDPEQAKALLEEAGYDGAPITILTNRRAGGYFERALVAQAMMAEVGLNAQLETMEWGTQLDKYVTGDYQMQSFAYSTRLDPALSFEMITGDHPRKVFRTPEAMELVEQAMTVSEPAKRQAIIDQLHEAFLEEVPAISVNHRVMFYAMKDHVSGFRGWGAAKEIYWNVGLAE